MNTILYQLINIQLHNTLRREIGNDQSGKKPSLSFSLRFIITL